MKIRSSWLFSVEDRPGIEVESPKCDGIVCGTDLQRIARWPCVSLGQAAKTIN
jgi:hypothetical protein